MLQSRNLLRLCGAAAALLWMQPAAAQNTPADQSSPPTGLWERANLLGDIGGLRPALQNVGISVTLQEIDEVLGNVTGGIHTGADYDGLATTSLSLDTD